MASPSGHKEGLRCSNKKMVSVKKSPEARFLGPATTFAECGGLVLEQDPEHGLGVRCYKKSCREFHPLEVLLSQAVEEGLLNPEQRDGIRRAVAESPQEKTKTRPEEAMATPRAEKIHSAEKAVEVLGAFIIALEAKQELIEEKGQARELRKQSLFAQTFHFFFYDLSASGLEIKITFDFSCLEYRRSEIFLHRVVNRGTITVEQLEELRNAVGYKVEFGFNGDRIMPIAP